MAMTLGIDVSMLRHQGSGVATYTYNLVRGLLEHYPENRYKLFYSSLRRPEEFRRLGQLRRLGARVYDFRVPPRVWEWCWNRHHWLNISRLIGPVDYYHSSDFLRPPLPATTRGVTTIHDLTWKLYPQYHQTEIVAVHQRKLERTIAGRDVIIVDSNNTKSDLIKYFPQVEKTNLVKVLPLAVDTKFRPVKDLGERRRVLAKYGLAPARPFLLYVGAIEPRKNLLTTVRVFHRLLADDRYADYRLVLAGRAGWKNQEVFQLIGELGLKSRVKQIGYVADDDLAGLYSAAQVLIYLSHYEGFGLPPVEAVKCGTPALLYTNSSLKELFSAKYPFTTPGDELATLKRLLAKPNEDYASYLTVKTGWRTYCQEFLSLLQ